MEKWTLRIVSGSANKLSVDFPMAPFSIFCPDFGFFAFANTAYAAELHSEARTEPEQMTSTTQANTT